MIRFGRFLIILFFFFSSFSALFAEDQNDSTLDFSASSNKSERKASSDNALDFSDLGNIKKTEKAKNKKLPKLGKKKNKKKEFRSVLPDQLNVAEKSKLEKKPTDSVKIKDKPLKNKIKNKSLNSNSEDREKKVLKGEEKLKTKKESVKSAKSKLPVAKKYADSYETQSILVMGLKSTQIDKAVTDSLAAVLVKEINDHPNYTAISRNEIAGMLDAEATKQALDCDSDACLVEIAGAFGAEKIISGNIAKLEGSLIVNLEIMNTSRAIVESRVNYNWKGKVSDLSDLVKVAAQSLILRKSEQKPATIVISRAQKGAKILVDGKEKGSLPEKIKDIGLGPHKLVLQLDGYEDFEGHFLAKNGDTTIIEAPMKEIEIPIYQKWWFWTAVGTSVLGIATAVMLSGDKNTQNINSLDTIVLDDVDSQTDIEAILGK